jgi:hypothetical protein
MAIDYKALADEAAEYENQSETTSGGGDYEQREIPAGVTFGRLIEYIELGVQKQPSYDNKPKPDADQVRITFELLHPKKNIRDVEIDGVTKQFADKISITIKKSLHEKSGFTKLFTAMKYGREVAHMGQMLNEAFLLTVTHNKSKDGKKTYYNLQNEGVYGISAPVIVDPVAETSTPIPVGKALSPIRIFLWNKPTKETWDSLFIDGDRTVKDAEGNEKQESKNWLQNKILSATNFAGSALEDLLSGSAELEAAIGEEEAPAKPAKTDTQKAAPAKKPVATVAKGSKAASTATSAPTASSKKAVTKAPAADPLAALGL